MDNDGKIMTIHDSTRAVDQLTSKGQNTIPVPEPENAGKIKLSSRTVNTEELLRNTIQEKLTLRSVDTDRNNLSEVPESSAVGYDLKGVTGTIVARREYEVDFGIGLKKRYKVTVPIFE